ncbi:MFS transporter [Peribacillus frigoritolerans]|nr:MFS transporter [Peribacillus frigoritolerans]
MLFFPGEAFNEWGWRVMFFTGILGAVAGLLVFRTLNESPLWAQLRKENEEKRARGCNTAVSY